MWPVIPVRATYSMYKDNIPHTVLTKRHFSIRYRCYFWLLRANLAENGLQQTQFASASDGFGAALNLQFVKNFAVMPFDRIQGEEKPLADLSIR